MIIIIFQIIFALCLIGILFIIFRKIPALLELERKSQEKVLVYETARKEWKKLKEKAESSEFLHNEIIPRTEKVLRRTKVVLLKLDNFLAKRADKLRDKVKKRKKENNLPE
jgi:DNA-directed RNA polymerase alpha subunit